MLTLSRGPSLFAGIVYVAQDGHERFVVGIPIAEDGISDGSISDSVPNESSESIPEVLADSVLHLEKSLDLNPSRLGLHLGPGK